MADPIVTPHTPTPAQQAQQAESAARAQAGNAIPPGETALALEPGDGAPQDPGSAPAPAAVPAEPAPKPIPEAKSAFDKKREAITARFRSERNVPTDQQEAIEDAVHAGLPPEYVPARQAPAQPEQQEEQPVAEADEADGAEGTDGPLPADAPPQTVKLKVHGKEIEVPLEEALAQAQIAYAANNILDDAKGKAKELDALLRDIRSRATVPAQPAQHQGGQNGPQSEAPPADPADPQNPEDPFGKLIETIQFGDPEEAKGLLRDTIGRVVQESTDRTLANARIQDDAARAAKTLKDFSDSHPEIANDPMAKAAIEANLFELQAKDLTALGLDPTRLRTDGLPTTPADIAMAHQHYRANGMNVRSPQQLLETATDTFLAWKGIKTPTSKPTAESPAPAPRAQPRIDVSVDRTARRQAVPQQPSRSAAPPPVAQQQPLARDRSSIVANMKAARAQKRGVVLGA